MIRLLRRGRKLRDERGQVFALFGIAGIAMLAMVGFVVDAGSVYTRHRELQAAADATASALADQLSDVKDGTITLTAAENAAKTYSAESGQKNAVSGLTGVTTTFTPKCITVNGSVPAWCNTSSTPNAIVVTQSATVGTTFAKVIGINNFSVSAKATASMGGGKPIPAHIIIVLDRTGSMSQSCSSGGTKISCAKAGINSFLLGMDPAYDKVGLVELPPMSNSGACATPKTSDGAPNDYDTYPNNYLIVGLSNDYKTSSSSTTLNGSSTLVSDVSCVKAGGTTALATAIDKAQATLLANHDSTAQDVIVFFTDGQATYGPCVDTSPNDGVCDNNASAYRSQPCHQAITSASNAKNNSTTKTWFYSILYDTSQTTQCWAWHSTGQGKSLSTGGLASCNTAEGIQFLGPYPNETSPTSTCYESPAITAYSTLQQMASDSTKFYYSPNPGSLTTIFQNISEDIGAPRLIDDSYTGN